jgi:hypothetical protein
MPSSLSVYALLKHEDNKLSVMKVNVNVVNLSIYAYNLCKDFIGKKYGSDNLIEFIAGEADDIDNNINKKNKFKVLPGYFLEKISPAEADKDGIFGEKPWADQVDYFEEFNVYSLIEKENIVVPAGYFTAAQTKKTLEKTLICSYFIKKIESFSNYDLQPYRKKSEELSSATGAGIAAQLHGVDLNLAIKNLTKKDERKIHQLDEKKYKSSEELYLKRREASFKWNVKAAKQEIIDEIEKLKIEDKDKNLDVSDYPHA